MSINGAIHIGKESTYGTPVTPTRSFEGKADSFKREQERLESSGLRSDYQGLRSDRVVQVNMGGNGSLEFDMLNKGMGMIFEGLLGSVAGPTQVAATSAYTQAHTTDQAGPTDSYTIQVVRPVVDGTVQQFTHHGCRATGWGITQDVGGLLVANVDYDFEDVDTSTAQASGVYPAASSPFAWTNAVIEIDSVAYGYSDAFSLTADLGMKTDRRYMAASTLKSAPVRSGVPSYTGSLSADFEGTTRYDEWVAGTVVGINIKWSMAASLIESGHTYEFELDMPACQWTGDSPTASMDEVSTQELPFVVMHDGSNPMITATIKSTDTAL